MVAQRGERSARTRVRRPPDDEALLETSPLVRSVLLTAEYMRGHGGVGLTRSGAFNRIFVHWAAVNFDWPDYPATDVFRFHKVLDERDFPPVVDIHVLLEGLQLARRRRSIFMLTSAGEELVSSPGRLFAELVPAYLFRMNHAGHLRDEPQLFESWDLFMNVINVTAHHPTTLTDLRAALFGSPDDETDRFDASRWLLLVTVLRPLSGAGLLKIQRQAQNGGDFLITKTELWRRFERLETDSKLRPRLVS